MIARVLLLALVAIACGAPPPNRCPGSAVLPHSARRLAAASAVTKRDVASQSCRTRVRSWNRAATRRATSSHPSPSPSETAGPPPSRRQDSSTFRTNPVRSTSLPFNLANVTEAETAAEVAANLAARSSLLVSQPETVTVDGVPGIRLVIETTDPLDTRATDIPPGDHAHARRGLDRVGSAPRPDPARRRRRRPGDHGRRVDRRMGSRRRAGDAGP